MSDSTGVSPSGFHPVGCSSSWDHGSDRSGGGATGGVQGYRQSSLGPGWNGGGWGPGGVPNPTDGYSSAFGGGGAQSRLHSLGARSDTGGSSDTAIAAALAAADPADLLECLFCGVATCLPNGPSTVKCSDCQAPMHKECFVAHYHVVPGRRDWTYCPTHAVAPKNQVPAKPHEKPPSARAAKVRRTAKRFRGDDGDETAAARSQRRRRNPEGIAAARRRAKLSDSDAHADIGSPSSSDGGGSGHRSLPPAMQRPRRARAVNYAAMDGAVEDEDGGEGDARTSGSAAAEDDAPPYRRFELPAPPAQQQIAPLSRVVPGSPDSNAASESGSAAQPGSPAAAAAAAVRDPAQDSPPAPLPAMSVNVRRPRQTQQPNMSDAAAPETPVAQSAAAAANGVRSPRSPPSRRPPAAAASAGPASPRRATPRKAPVQVAAAAEVRTLAAERQKPKSPPAKSAADLADEELAMQLHQELNASSRRRGMRGPSTTIATTPGGMQALDGA